MATQNQAKAADLLKMLRSSGVDTMADELEEIIAEAWDEGEQSVGGDRLRESNPYRPVAPEEYRREFPPGREKETHNG